LLYRSKLRSRLNKPKIIKAKTFYHALQSPGLREYSIQPKEASYNTEMGEFLLPYDVVRTADSPDDALLAFLQSTFEAAATCAKWNRDMERQ
jgi:hypothetical protein